LPQAARMVEEITSCWCLLSLKRCCTAAPGSEVSVPLYYGSIYEPQVRDVRKGVGVCSTRKP
jgi:hypothetical protein